MGVLPELTTTQGLQPNQTFSVMPFPFATLGKTKRKKKK